MQVLVDTSVSQTLQTDSSQNILVEDWVTVPDSTSSSNFFCTLVFGII